MVRLLLFGFLLFFLMPQVSLRAQSPNKYGLKVIDTPAGYRQTVLQDSANQLVDLENFIPGIVLDIRYATPNNFMMEPVYRLPKAFVRLPVARALKAAQTELAKEGLGLKIYDAYRPYRVTVYFYDKLQDSVFLAVPWRGSRHNRGTTVDLTLISLKNGQELPMPTPYDQLSDRAHINYKGLPARIRKNRDKLHAVMRRHGFTVYAPEWWHYDFTDFARFDLLDLPFEDLLPLISPKH